MAAMLIDCRPEIVSRDGSEITLRFSSEEERQDFEEAVRMAKSSPEEHIDRHARAFNLPPYGLSLVGE